MLRPVHLDPALIGQPLPCNVYTGSGVLVAGAGLVLADQAHFDKLTAHPLFRDGEFAAPADSPLQRLAELAKQAERVLKSSEPSDIRVLANELLAVYRADADACLGYSGLAPPARVSVNHAVRVMFVAQMLAESLELSEVEQESLAAAALTMNLAVLDLHDRLHATAGVLREADRTALRGHPEASARLLQAAGVSDPVWLEAVRQHHENMDGSGYPAGLPGTAISLPARLLRVADFYCAKLSGRNYRPPKSPSFAFQELFGRERSRLDSLAATLLLRRMGIYPPGTLVRLANRETACIARRAQRGARRWAVSVLDPRGRALVPPELRELGTRNGAIVGTAEREPDWPPINWMAVWGY